MHKKLALLALKNRMNQATCFRDLYETHKNKTDPKQSQLANLHQQERNKQEQSGRGETAKTKLQSNPGGCQRGRRRRRGPRKRIEGLTLAQQLAADWKHLRERHQLLVLLQQLRQVLAAATDAIQSNPIRRPKAGGEKNRGNQFRTAVHTPNTDTKQQSFNQTTNRTQSQRLLPAYVRRPGGGPDLRRHGPGR